MPYRRAARRTVRRRPIRRRPIRRRPVRKQAPRKDFLMVKRYAAGRTAEIYTGTGVSGGYIDTFAFRLNNVQSYTDFAGVFRFYKICGVKYRWVLRNLAPTGAWESYPALTWTFDQYLNNTPYAQANLLQFPGCKRFQFSENRSYTKWYFIRPKSQSVGYESATQSFYTPRTQWIDMASADTPHYGISYYSESLPTGATLECEAIYYLAFKGAF